MACKFARIWCKGTVAHTIHPRLTANALGLRGLLFLRETKWPLCPSNGNSPILHNRAEILISSLASADILAKSLYSSSALTSVF